MAEERQYASTDNKENQTNVRLSDEEKSNLIKFYQKGSEREPLTVKSSSVKSDEIFTF